ncbi:ABC transporter substrate-binding protein [Virgibacillus senegalensis]|uniref:ABC transporter substrate-binding protein n=1 Tax=Virgibacillus senegalensis TaxID=1499679 RepID=UPI00069EE737|nr:extracellular solute-binding protein [Virgibacillus senegalensis]
MNRKAVAKRLCSLCCLSFLLIGCTSADNSDRVTDDSPIVLKFWGGVPKEAGPQAVIDLWNSKHPDVQVDYMRYSNDDNGNLRLDTALLNETDVDMFVNYFSYNYKQRVKMGLTTDLASIDPDYDVEEKVGSEAEEWKVDGQYHAMPTKKNFYFILLNKDLLKEKGLPIPADWSWKELRRYAEQLSTKDRWGFVQYDFVLPYPIDGTLGENGSIKSDGTSNFDHIAVSKHLKLLYDMMYKDKSMPALPEQLLKKMPIDMQFLEGKAAMLFGGEWVLRYVNSNKIAGTPSFDVAFAPIPKMSEDQTDFRYIGGVGDAISINANSRYKEEAMEFIKWYVDEGMYAMARGGRLPASKDADLEKALHLLIGAHERFDNQSLERIINGDLPTMQLTLDQEVIEMRKEAFEHYFSKSATLEETLERLTARHNAYLKTAD